MKLRGVAGLGVKILVGFAPVLNEANDWAEDEELPAPLVTDAEDDIAMDRYSAIVPGQLWLHRDWRMVGWGYRFWNKLQFKLEYRPEGADRHTHRKTFRLPLI